VISLNRQLFLASFLAGALPLAILAVVSLSVVSGQVESSLQDRLLAGARGAELAVEIGVDRIRARATALARDPLLLRNLLEQRQRAVLGLAENALELMDVDRVTIVDPTRRVIARGHAPAEDGDLWRETELPRTTRASSTIRSGSVGMGILVAVPVIDADQQVHAWLLVQKALDYAALLELESEFGLDFSVWDGARLQATTLRSREDLVEAEEAHRELTATGTDTSAVHIGSAHHFARARFQGETPGAGALLLAIDHRVAAGLSSQLSTLYLAVAFATLALSAAGAYLSARRIARPVRRLASAAEAVAEGELDTAVPAEGPYEIQELAASFNNMLTKRREAEAELRRIQVELEQRVAARTEALRQSEEHLQQSRQLEALGRLAGGVAHDFNNVLTVISGNAELLAMDLSALNAPEQVKLGLSEIQESASHAAEIIRQLMAFSRQQVAEPVVIDLGHVVLDLEKMLRRLCTEDVALSIEVEPGPHSILADPTQIGQVLVNLVVNAQDALPAGGRVRIRAYQQDNDPLQESSAIELGSGRHVCLEVADDGTGMDAETSRRIFEPFFTTKAAGKGTGMGLATVHGIARQCGAQITVETQPGQGAKFRILFPAAVSATETTPHSRKVETATPRGRETILLCEDEAHVRTLTASFLRSGDYDVVAASSGQEATELAAQRPEIALLVTDVVMPEMNGVQLARQLREGLPRLRVLYLSGYTATIIDSRTDSGARDELLAKPFTRAELLRRVRRALDDGIRAKSDQNSTVEKQR
jgi:signal transduction histidine kinase/ActR/RegA family two-component response regulator